MANLIPFFTLSLLTTFSLTFPATGTFWKPIKPRPIAFKPEKLTHFHFYWHDTETGPNTTSINIIKPHPKNATLGSLGSLGSLGFGNVNMFDDPLTRKAGNDSKVIGRAQGFYGVGSREENVLVMVMSFVFTSGKYNGSTLTVVGRNPVVEKVREMAVAGGTGRFRLARGFVQAKSCRVSVERRDAVVMYDVYVLHQ